MASKAILNVLTTPSKVASKLDWRRASGSVLSLDIHQDRIGLAIASHPTYGEGISTLRPITLQRKGRVNEECRIALSKIVKEHKVCGVVVSWPLQDSGKMGAACGRVLYTLENILQEDSTIITPNRPFCLWDGNHSSKEEEEDGFGRSVAYSRVPSKSNLVHRASKEQYCQDENENTAAAQVWDDFYRSHWPDLYRQQQRQQFIADRNQKQHERESHFLKENWEDSSSYVNLAVL